MVVNVDMVVFAGINMSSSSMSWNFKKNCIINIVVYIYIYLYQVNI